jgi:hypothetical protein
MTISATKQLLTSMGFSDTRVQDLAFAARELHSSCCHLDAGNLALFTERYSGKNGIFLFMSDYSKLEEGTRDLEPLCEPLSTHWSPELVDYAREVKNVIGTITSDYEGKINGK